MSLDTFVSSSRPKPIQVSTSQEIRDRSSRFVAHLYRARTLADARAAQQHAARAHASSSRPTHVMYGWRGMSLRPKRTGLGEDDFMLEEVKEDDGEKWGGERILKVMREEGILDACVLVLRWFGGEMLGPQRFTHIETTAREACRDYKIKDELEDTVRILHTLDGELAKQRIKLQSITDISGPSSQQKEETATTETRPGNESHAEAQKGVEAAAEEPKAADANNEVPRSADADSLIQLGKRKRTATDATDYAELIVTKDTKKARRLVTARENAIKSVKALIAKKEKEMKDENGQVTPQTDAKTPIVDVS